MNFTIKYDTYVLHMFGLVGSQVEDYRIFNRAD
jgi:hypothetical protein